MKSSDVLYKHKVWSTSVSKGHTHPPRDTTSLTLTL